MTSLPKISIVTPSYNQGEFIEETIASVLNQNYPNLEYIIIDGNSTDNTVEIIKKYEKHLFYWVSEPDKGQSHAINKGLMRATGDIFNWLNSDDYYEPGTFERMAQLFQDPTLLCVSGKGRKFGDSLPMEGILTPPEHSIQDFEYEVLNMELFQPATFLRKSAYSSLGPLQEDLHYSMDYEWYVRYFFRFGNKNILKTDSIFTNFRVHNNSKSISQFILFEKDNNSIYLNIAKQINAPEKTIEKICQYPTIENFSSKLEILINYDRSKLLKYLESKFDSRNQDDSLVYREYATYMNRHGNTLGTLIFSFKAIQNNPFLWLNYKYTLHAILQHVKSLIQKK